MNREAEQMRLSEADTNISRAERAVTEQLIQLEKLRRDGHDTKLAERTLKSFQESLGTLREHRDLIIRTIEQIDAGLI